MKSSQTLNVPIQSLTGQAAFRIKLLASSLLILLLSPAGFGQRAGTPDRGFGDGGEGFARLDNPASGSTWEQIWDLKEDAATSDIIVVGRLKRDPGPLHNTYHYPHIARFNAAGTKIWEKGISGGTESGDHYYRSLTILDDGKYLASGNSGNTGIAHLYSPANALLATLNIPNMKVYDSSFLTRLGEHEKVILAGVPVYGVSPVRCIGIYDNSSVSHMSGFNDNYDGSDEFRWPALGIAVSGDSIFVTGPDPTTQRRALWKAGSDGMLDNSFGVNGRLVENTASDGNAVAVDHFGRLVVGGSRNGVDTVWRFTAAGDPDITFGVGGVLSHPFTGSHAGCKKIVIDHRNRIIVLGSRYVSRHRERDGSLDPTFDETGLYSFPAGYEARGLAIQQDGKILIGGDTDYDGYIRRLHATSDLDAWMAAHGHSEPMAPFDGSSISNLMAYALGVDLMANPNDALPEMTFCETEAGGDRYPALRYRVRRGATHINHAVEVSEDLSTWHSGQGHTANVGDLVVNPDGTATITTRALVALSTSSKLYLRLRVDNNPLLDAQKDEILQTYAPLVWLAKDERFMPSSVDWAFPQMDRFLHTDEKGNTYWWIKSKQPLSSPSDSTLPLFRGNLAGAPVYAFWVDKPYDVQDLVYFFFFPYNRGKEEFNTVFGNHVGDWEHVTVRLIAGQPSAIYLSAHNFGASYEWESVAKDGGTHPVVYCANGSHGFWRDNGDHAYEIPVLGTDYTLYDNCSQGTRWETWQRVESFDYHGKRGLGTSVWPAWMSTNFSDSGIGDPKIPGNGPIFRWGNVRDGSLFFGAVYRLEQGPTGPVSKEVWGSDIFK